MRVLIITDRLTNNLSFFKDSLQSQPIIEKIAVALNSDEIVREVMDNHVDIIICCGKADHFTPVALERLRGHRIIAPPMILMTSTLNAATIHRAFRHGFNEVIDVDATMEELNEVMRKVMAGELDIRDVPVCDTLRRLLPESNRISLIDDQLDLEICRLLSEGKSNKEIADCIAYSSQTVRNRMVRIFNVTGVKNRISVANLYVA